MDLDRNAFDALDVRFPGNGREKRLIDQSSEQGVYMRDHTIGTIDAARGNPVYASDGEKIGTVEEIFHDDETNRAEWVGVGTGFFGTKRVLVPTEGAELRDDGLHVPYDKDHVKDSPDADSDEIGEELERELYAYYGLEASQRRSEPGRGTRRDAAEVTRSEEELQVGTREYEAGRARLSKWVETEPVHMDVELQRETARVTRERVDRPVDGAEIGDEEVEVTLREEQPVVAKRTVAKERIGLEKDVETQRERVSGQVRKERVDVHDDAA